MALTTLFPGYRERSDTEPDVLQKKADHCNDRRMASKRVQELSIGLFFAILVKVSPSLVPSPPPHLLLLGALSPGSSRSASMLSSLLFGKSAMAGALSLQESGPLESEAMVMGVLNQAFDVLVLRYGVQKRIYCNVSMPSVKGGAGTSRPSHPSEDCALMGLSTVFPAYLYSCC